MSKEDQINDFTYNMGVHIMNVYNINYSYEFDVHKILGDIARNRLHPNCNIKSLEAMIYAITLPAKESGVSPVLLLSIFAGIAGVDPRVYKRKYSLVNTLPKGLILICKGNPDENFIKVIREFSTFKGFDLLNYLLHNHNIKDARDVRPFILMCPAAQDILRCHEIYSNKYKNRHIK